MSDRSYTEAPTMRTPALPLASALILSSLAALVFAPATTGCAAASDDDVGTGELAATSDDLVAAKQIVELLGGANGKCKQCHGVTASKLKAWGTAMKDVEAECFAPTNLTPQQRIDCLKADPEYPESGFSPRRLGLYATGVQQAEMKALWQSAYSADLWAAEYAAFAQRAAMPRGGAALSTADFAKIKAWVLRGMPQLDEAFAPAADAGTEPAAACTPKTTPELAAHLARMKTEGWGARLADQATPMYGCAGTTDPLECLATLPKSTAFSAANVPQTVRELYTQKLSSHYWVRSSADGRYVGFGMNDSAKIVDLTKPVTAKPIAVEADYDPLFLPSNDGFAFAGSHADNAIRLCKQSLLADVGTASSPKINLTESKCTALAKDVYMSIGTALEGNRYFMTYGSHENDDGGHDITSPLPAAFGANAATRFTPMVNDGISYKAQAPVTVKLPKEGDMMLSPSSLVAATRFGDGAKSKGYRVRLVKASTNASGALAVDLPLAAEVCLNGQKIGFSFDERFMVTHQYVDTTDPTEAGLPAGSSNIVIADLATGKQVRVTTTKKGQFALYPHFRADGWLYFVVRDMNANKEYVVASDVALRMSAP